MKKRKWRVPRKLKFFILHFSFFILPSELQPFGEAFRQAGGADFFLGGGDVVIEPAKFNGSGVHVVNDIGGLGVVVARLADGADVDEILFGRINFKFGIGAAADGGVAHEGDGHVGVAEEADLGVLLGKAGGGGELVEDVTPALRRIERGVNHREAGGHAGVLEIAQPLAFFLGKLFARPVNGVGGMGIETFQRVVGGTVFVMISLYTGDVHFADDGEAFPGVGVVADDVAETDDMRRV